MVVDKPEIDVAVLNGVASSAGIALGRAYQVDRNRIQVPQQHLAPGTMDHDLERLETAFVISRHQLHQAREMLSGDDHLQILDTHIAVLEDPELEKDARRRIITKNINAEWAVKQVFDKAASIFEKAEDPYLRERKRDFEQIAQRLLANLMGLHREGLDQIDEPVIVVAHDLSPADMAHLNRQFVKGIITDVGGPTSHTSILARAMEIPAVVGTETITRDVKTGDLLIIDGFEGRVILNPSMELIAEYETRRRFHADLQNKLLLLRDVPAATGDGRPVQLAANVELPSELSVLRDNGLARVGLFRTEFLFLMGDHIPTEDEQVKSYRHMIDGLGAEGVTTIRTIDVGGDKIGPEFRLEGEANPAMGLRAIRFCLANPDLFRTQLRAILRASAHGKVRIMFPMISGVEELRRAKEILARVQDELRNEGVAFDEKIQIGIMVEIPSAAFIADLLAREVDFFSIGTNDLIQYTLAIDRSNEHVNYLFSPMHPAILRGISLIVKAGHEAGIPVAMCGEMAGQPEYVMLLLGLGIDELSMSPHSVLRIKRLIQRFTMEQARTLAGETMRFATAGEVSDHVVNFMRSHFPEEFWLPAWCESGPCLERNDAD
ncbi:MAG TPA: phosphoenolpyruvate--protein phosphotransferase [bacterium]|nr:phosphoenolpyruvate--protein phosphotransferase [bacterium]